MIDYHGLFPPGYGLPIIWTQTTIENKLYMFGFMKGALYSFYITDMELVWADTPTPEKVYKKALKRGIAEFDNDKFEILKLNLDKAVRETGARMSFSRVSPLIFAAEVIISEHLSWPLEAVLCDLGAAVGFFRSLCCQSLANKGLSLYKEFQLENMLRVRDEYTLYLEENYKTVNGTELMDKYRQQHPDCARLLLKYSKPDFDAKVGSQYAEYLHKTTKDEALGRLWKELGLMVEHQKEWAAAAQSFRVSRDAEADKLLKRSPSPDQPGPHRKRSKSHSENAILRDFEVKMEPDESKVASVESSLVAKRIFPTKRKRLGLVRRR